MTDVQKEKAVFVKERLLPLVSFAREDIGTLRYRVDGPREFVDIIYDNGYKRTVNVSADSLTAIALDVLNHA